MTENQNDKLKTLERPPTLTAYGKHSPYLFLPFYKDVKPFLPPPPLTVPLNPDAFTEACGTKIVGGAAIGAVMGAALGLFFGAMGDNSPIQVIQGREVPQAPIREQIRISYKSTFSRMSSNARTFGVISALFGGIECVIEKYRAKHDVWNPVVSGCIVGATVSASGGPAAACMGCAGFAGFSLLIDKIMPQH